MEQKGFLDREMTRRDAIKTAGALVLSVAYGCNDGITNPKPDPSINMSLSLEDLVDVKCSVSIQNIDQATLKVYRGGEINPFITQPISDTVSGEDFGKVFSYAEDEFTKGNYRFVLEAQGLNPITKEITIENYLPEVDFASVNADFDEGSQLTVALPQPTDKNPEDNPVQYTGFEDGSASGPARVSVIPNGNNEIIITGEEGKVGNYQVMVEFGSGSGGVNTTTLEGRIHDLLDIRGVLEDTETGSRYPGLVRVYDENKQKLAEIPVDESGEFNERLPHRVEDLTDRIFVQARAINPVTGQPESYVRTLNLPAEDADKKIVVVPYGGLYGLASVGISPEDFYRHFAEVLTRDELKPETDPLTWNPVLLMWQKIPEIVICKNHRDSTKEGTFSAQGAEKAKNTYFDIDNNGAWFRGRITPNTVSIIENCQAPWNDFLTGASEEHYGRLYVFPENNITGFGPARDFNGDGYIDLAEIRIGVTNEGEIRNYWSFMHENGHIIGFQGHAKTLIRKELETNIEYTRMGAGTRDEGGFRYIDYKTAAVMNQPTYTHGEGSEPDELLRLNDVLGFEFFDN